MIKLIIEPTSQIIVSVLNHSKNKNIREQSANCLPYLLKVACNDKELQICLCKIYINGLWEAILLEDQPETISVIIKSN